MNEAPIFLYCISLKFIAFRALFIDYTTMLKKRHLKPLFLIFAIIYLLYVALIGVYYLFAFFDPVPSKVQDAEKAFYLGQKYHNLDVLLQNDQKAKEYYIQAEKLGIIQAGAFYALLMNETDTNSNIKKAEIKALRTLDTEYANIGHLALGHIYTIKGSDLYAPEQAEYHLLIAAESKLPAAVADLVLFYSNTNQLDEMLYWHSKFKKIESNDPNLPLFPEHIFEWYIQKSPPHILNYWYTRGN